MWVRVRVGIRVTASKKGGGKGKREGYFEEAFVKFIDSETNLVHGFF